jgi:hypothetical protein
VANIGIKLEVATLTLKNKPPQKVGNITYAPAVSNVAQGELITWSFEGPFTLVFRERTPFDDAVLHSEKETATSQIVKKLVRADAPPDIYYYAVGIGTKDGIFVDAGCPAVIVH